MAYLRNDVRRHCNGTEANPQKFTIMGTKSEPENAGNVLKEFIAVCT